MNNHKILIAYYSRAGNNYVGGRVLNLPVGNTKVAAQIIKEQCGGDLFEVDTVSQYPEDYHETTNVAMKELQDDARPDLTDKVENMAHYDVIFLGYPNWWGTMPMAVFSFLENYDLSGKTIIPFCTHEGSGMGHSEQDIKRICAGSKVLKGLAIRGAKVKTADRDISRWLQELGWM